MSHTSVEPTDTADPLRVAASPADASLIAALVGKKQLKQAAPPVPERAVASVKTDLAEIKESIKQ